MGANRATLRGSARVLVVDEAHEARLMSLALSHSVYAVRVATTIPEAERFFEEWDPHLAVIDIDLADRRAIELLGRPRPKGARLPSIAITQRGDMKTKLAAFERGADDFLTAPFSPEELVARVLAVMRRTYGEQIQFIPVITVGDVKIDMLNQRVRVGAARPKLTAIEQSLLYLLASNAGDIVTREQILDTLWGQDYVAESNVVDRHVRNLRVKLKDDWRRPRYIATISGKGYRFLVAPKAVSESG